LQYMFVYIRDGVNLICF